MTNAIRNQLVIPAVLLLGAIALSFPIYFFGMPTGNDLPQHYRFVYSFYEAIQSGEFYPAWSGDTNLGFGDVGIRFYPPLAYYVVVLFRSVTESWTTALAITTCFWFFVGGMGVYLLARESFSEKASIAAALIFMLMPYHVNQIYNAGLFAEFAGLAILPYSFLFARRTIYQGRLIDVAALAAAYALLIITHLPIVIIGSIGLTVYCVAMLRARTLGVSLLKLGSSVMMALAASSFYWVRMVSELGFVNHTRPEFSDQAYDFRINFLGSIFYLPQGQYSETSGWFTDLLFAITLAMIVPALIVLILKWKSLDKNKFVPFLAVLFAAILISTPLSIWLWDNVGFLERIQFPWRFLGLISLAGSVLIAAFFDDVPALFRSRLRPVGLIAVGLIVAGVAFTGAQVIKPANYLTRADFDNSFDAYRTDKSYECWWPVWADRRAFSNSERVLSPSRPVEISEWASSGRSFTVEAGLGEEIRVATFYYPYWKAQIDGENVDVSRAEDGTMLIAVPPQRSAVRLYFAEPAHEIAAKYISMVAWVLIAGALVVGSVTKLKQRRLV